MPKGQWFHLSGGTIPLEPGKSLLINLPRNHVSKWWFVEIPFAFALEPTPTRTIAPGPSLRLKFADEEIPFSKR
jgi:hypothetical protein